MNHSAALLLFNAAILGFRHGIDWDHIATIADIVGTTTSRQKTINQSWTSLHKQALGLPFLYALGHASIVLLLGLCALLFARALPRWIDSLMERVVGATLVMLGVWVFYALFSYLRGQGSIRLQSRCHIVFAVVLRLWHWSCTHIAGQSSKPFVVDRYINGRCTAFGVGVIHGIGAETGTQILLLATLGGVTNQELGVSMLIAFVIGLLISNTLIAVLCLTGFVSSVRLAPVFISVAVVAGCFSLFVGSYFVSGHAQSLPELRGLLSSL